MRELKGARTRIVAETGLVAFYRGDAREGVCVATLDFVAPALAAPYANVDRLIRACGGDAVFGVKSSLIADFQKIDDPVQAAKLGFEGPLWLVDWDFTLVVA